MLIPDQVYNSIQRDLLRKHFDAADTVFLERELTQLRAKIYSVEFPEPLARKFLPKATDIAASAMSYTYKVLKPVGRADVVANGAHDLPRLDVVASEVLGTVKTVGGSYGWDINELREAARVGVPLSDMKARNARDLIERAIDEVLAFGDLSVSEGKTGNDLLGISNNTDISGLGITAGQFWFAGSPPTSASILAELVSFITNIRTTSKQRWNANTLLLPTAHYEYIKNTPYSTYSGDSILTVLKKNNEALKVVEPWYRLDTAGAANKPRGIAYQMDPMTAEAIIPQEFQQLPPEARGLEFIINCTARAGGVKVYQPTAFKYADFATS